MGIITNTIDLFSEKISKVDDFVGNTLAKVASVSPDQVIEIEEKKEKYISEIEGKIDSNAIKRKLGEVGIEVYQVYLEQLKDLYKPIKISWPVAEDKQRIRHFDITQLVTDPEEKDIDKLVNVYQVLREEECTIALIYNRTCEGCTVTIGVANIGEESNPEKVEVYQDRLVSALKGNFPGIEIKEEKQERNKRGIPKSLNTVSNESQLDNEKVNSVAIISNLASEKSENFVSQSMEKLLDGIIPQNKREEYTLVLLAQPVRDNLERQNRIFEMYSELTPNASWQINYNYHKDTNKGAGGELGGNVNEGIITSASMGGEGVSVAKNKSTNFGLNFSKSASMEISVGTGCGLTQNNTNYSVKHTLDILDEQMKRLEESSALGAWEFAAYVTSESAVIANNVAHMYLALTQGEQSFMSKTAVSLWDGERETDETRVIMESIQRLRHPLFALNEKQYPDEDWLMYPTVITPSVMLSGKELARSLNLPRKSVNGFAVFESAAFGREVQTFNVNRNIDERTIHIGHIYHMRQQELTSVSLNIDSLTSHVFVTGSTGAGKSNTIYQILNKLEDKGVNYLIIEPAKGEYKRVFGGKCQVYGTNSNISQLLRINPFSFPDKIHVLEHIDRLVEIFNACWPMYAAMPAVLKDAIEKAYESVGWNLRSSVCKPRIFPTFMDLLKKLPEVMESSLYSSDTKSDYSGALVTRVRSLTNGINGQIFCSGKELTNEQLFNDNVIVDFSRVGSGETKALLMGIMVMRLQEYRMSLEQMNSKLIHVTVLEEAHNLLRKTSTDQSQESANLQGKAVEMLTNAIAEMRTYGEGFIIADQAPSLLDEAVIRNTNTKIVLRLPDGKDRDLVGTSMALKDDQIAELAKLPTGVAALYQNDWIEAVLCKFDKYDENRYCPYEYRPENETNVIEKFLLKVFQIEDSYELSREDVDTIRNWIHNLPNNNRTKYLLEKVLRGQALNGEEKEIVAYNVFQGENVYSELNESLDVGEGIERVKGRIYSQYNLSNMLLVDQIFQIIVLYINKYLGECEFTDRYNIDRIERGAVM